MANNGMSALGRTLLRPFPKLKARLRRLRNAYTESGRTPYKPTATVDFEHASGERRLDPFHLEEMISGVVESDRRIEIASGIRFTMSRSCDGESNSRRPLDQRKEETEAKALLSPLPTSAWVTPTPCMRSESGTLPLPWV
jgi:hypothetical protein